MDELARRVTNLENDHGGRLRSLESSLTRLSTILEESLEPRMAAMQASLDKVVNAFSFTNILKAGAALATIAAGIFGGVTLMVEGIKLLMAVIQHAK